MLTNPVYLNYANQIAGVFCEGSNIPLCNAVVKERIVNYFNDTTFQNKFLPFLDSSRFFALGIAHAASSEGFIKYNLNGFDIVTGNNKSMMIDGIPGEKRNDVAWVINQHLNAWYNATNQPNHATYLGKINRKHIIQIQTPNNYGIVFIPTSGGGGSGGGGGGGGGGSQPCPPGQVMFGGVCTGGTVTTPKPGDPVIMQPEVITAGIQDFDIKLLLIPGALLAGYYFFVRK